MVRVSRAAEDDLQAWYGSPDEFAVPVRWGSGLPHIIVDDGDRDEDLFPSVPCEGQFLPDGHDLDDIVLDFCSGVWYWKMYYIMMFSRMWRAATCPFQSRGAAQLHIMVVANFKLRIVSSRSIMVFRINCGLGSHVHEITFFVLMPRFVMRACTYCLPAR